MIDPIVTAALISTAGNLGAGFLGGGGGSEGLSRADQRFMADFQWKQSLRNEAYQKQLAEHGISMRVKDAVDAGLHPLVGAGVNPSGGAPFASAFTLNPETKGPSHWANTVDSMGQNISRAIMATKSQEEREAHKLNMRNLKLQGDYVQEQINDIQFKRAQAKNPPIPLAFQQYQLPDGSTVSRYTPEYSASIMGDPFRSNLESFGNYFFGPDTRERWKYFDPRSDGAKPGWRTLEVQQPPIFP